jgi:hypothetical protein
MNDPRSEYEPVRTHYQGQRNREWCLVRHKELQTKHIYHIRCHKLSDYVEGKTIQVCATCDTILSEEPVVVHPPRQPEHHCSGCRCWENVR